MPRLPSQAAAAQALAGLDLAWSSPVARALSNVDASRGEFVDAFVLVAMIIALDHVSDGALEISGQMIVFEQD